MSVGSRIKQAREAKKITQEELGDLCGTTKQSIFKYENGVVTNIPFDRLERIASVLDVSPAYLMGWESDISDPRSIISPVDFSNLKKIPILGRIAAGLPIYAEENIEGYTYTDLNGGSEYFALRVQGDSMNAARINDGDIVIVRKQDEVENGQIAVVIVGDNEATLKRFHQEGSMVTLMPQSTNPENQPFLFDIRTTSIRILGLVVRVEFAPV